MSSDEHCDGATLVVSKHRPSGAGQAHLVIIECHGLGSFMIKEPQASCRDIQGPYRAGLAADGGVV